MNERAIQEMGFLVRLTVPASWDPETAVRELLHAIGFGQPRVDIIYDNPIPEPVSPHEPVA
jgi:hypothetical protein